MHTPQLRPLAPAMLATLLLTACHGHDATPAPTDSISFADTMTIDEHPNNDAGIVNTATPTYEAPDDTARHKAAPAQNDNETTDEATDDDAVAPTDDHATTHGGEHTGN